MRMWKWMWGVDVDVDVATLQAPPLATVPRWLAAGSDTAR